MARKQARPRATQQHILEPLQTTCRSGNSAIHVKFADQPKKRKEGAQLIVPPLFVSRSWESISGSYCVQVLFHMNGERHEHHVLWTQLTLFAHGPAIEAQL